MLVMLTLIVSQTCLAQGTTLVPTDPTVNIKDWALSSNGGGVSTNGCTGNGMQISQLIDGELNTAFESNDGVSPYNQYLTCDIPSGKTLTFNLGTERTISLIQFRLYDGDDRYFQYRIESSLDGATYETLIDKSTGEHRGIQELNFPAPVTVKYLRLIGLKSSVNNAFHILEEFHIAGKEESPVIPHSAEVLTIDGKAISGTAHSVGIKRTLHAGVYRVSYVSGAVSPFGSDSSNGGKTWLANFDVSIPLFTKRYQHGFVHAAMSYFASPTGVAEQYSGSGIFVYLPTESDVYFYFHDTNPSDNRGSMDIRLEQVSGPNDSLLSRVRDAMTRSVLWQQRAVANWSSWITTSDYNCFGCHIQSQATVGLNESFKKLPELPIYEPLQDYEVKAYKGWQNLNGWVSPFHGGGLVVSQTSLWAWAAASFTGAHLESLAPNLFSAVNYLLGNQNANGGWYPDHTGSSDPIYNDGGPSAAHTAGNIQALSKLLSLLENDSFISLPNVTFNANEVTFTEKNVTEIVHQVDPIQEVTAVRLTISQSFQGAGNFVLGELELFNDAEKQSITSALANFAQSGFPISESHDGIKNDINNGWAYSPQVVTTNPAVGVWLLNEPATINTLRFTEIYPGLQLKKYKLEYSTDASPNLSSTFHPFEITDIGSAVLEPGSVAAQYTTAIRKAATLFSSSGWDFTRNTRTAAQTIIGLHTALPVLVGADAEAAKNRLGAVAQYLRQIQRADGGWSDAKNGGGVSRVYPSAQALRALLIVSDAQVDDAIERAAKFLLNTQDFYGSWSSPPIDTKLAVTTWVEIALPTLFEFLTDAFEHSIIDDLLAVGLSGKVVLTWSPIPSATGYNIYRRTTDGSWFKVANDHKTTEASFSDEGLANGATYFYKVTFLDVQGIESAESNEASGTPSGFQCDNDSPPLIVSEPVTGATQDALYQYQVEALDPDDNEILTYALLLPPPGMQIDSLTGLIQWTPSAADNGTKLVRVKVEDILGHAAFQSYQLKVAPIFFNYPPKFVSTAKTSGTVGNTYIYDADAIDNNTGDVLTYSLAQAPAGAKINSTTGKISWKPKETDTGNQQFVIRVTDVAQAFDEQSFLVSIVTNAPPAITTNGPLSAPKHLVYVYDVDAEDPEGGLLTYSLIQNPAGMTINKKTGFIAWKAGEPDVGDHEVLIQVTDPAGAIDEEHFILNVPPDAPPVINSNAPTHGFVSALYTYKVIAADPEGTPLTYTLKSSPSGMSISNKGEISWVPTNEQTGDNNEASIRVTDGAGLFAEQTFTVSVSGEAPGGLGGGNSSTAGGITVTINAPTLGTTIEKSANFLATITNTDAAPITWRAELRRGDNPNDPVGPAIPLLTGVGAITEGVVGSIDPTTLANDFYILWIYVTKNGTEYGFYFGYPVSSNLKFGAFKLKVTDLTLPFTGIPINVSRAYDSQDISKSEFGYGWRLSYPGKVVDAAAENPLQPYASGSKVFITKLDGKRVGFSFAPYAPSFFPVYFPYFKPDAGVVDKLEVDSTGLFNAGGVFIDFFEYYNPSRFYLTTKDKLRYTIDEKLGLQEIRDPNGNTVTFTNSTIVHSSGEMVQVIKDLEGRIHKILDPVGQEFLYTYDNNGDLISVKDPLLQEVKYSYENHRLKTITNPEGILVLTNTYDVQGRLVKQIDASGNEIILSIDEANLTESLTDRLGKITTFKYDDVGNLLQKIDPLGGVTSYSYDQNFNVTSETTPLGAKTNYTYDGSSNLLKRIDALGNATQYFYNGLNQVTKEINALGKEISRSYDAYGNLLTETDFDGNTSTFTYDSNGNLTSTTSKIATVTNFTFDSHGNVIAITDPLGKQTQLQYDGKGNLIQQGVARTDNDGVQLSVIKKMEFDELSRMVALVDGEGKISHVENNSQNLPVKVTDNNGNIRLFEYDLYGNRTKVSYQDSTVETYEYDAENRLTRILDRMNRKTEFEYDETGRQTKVIFPDNTSIRVEYDLDGRITAEYDAHNHKTSYEYDSLGRKTKVIDPTGATTSYTYDALGRELTMIDALGRVTSYEYDDNGLLLKTTYPDGSVEKHEYDGEGRETKRTDQNGNTTIYFYDALGRLIKVKDSEGGETKYEYDEIGNKIKQIDAENHVTKFYYDNVGRVIKKVLPLGMFETHSYDPNGNEIVHQDFNGKITHFEYTSDNWLKKKIYPNATTIEFEYFPSGQRKKVNDASGVTLYEYDNRDRLKKVTNPNGAFVAYGYDLVGNRTSLQTANGVTLYEFDSRNNLHTVRDSSNNETTYAYDSVGNETETHYPNGIRSEKIYDDLNRELVIETKKDSLLLQRFDYTYDPVGNRLSLSENSGRVSNYSYDTLYRLTQAAITDPQLGDEATVYTYDKVGNRHSETTAQGTLLYTYDANDRMLTAGSTSFTYDNNGNTLTENSSIGLKSYGWDTENRLTSFIKPGVQAAYEYDVNAIRRSSTVNGTATDFLIDHNQDYAQVLEENTNNQLDVAYTYGSDLLTQNRLGTITHYLYDGLGSVRGLASSGGAISDSYVYEPFGEIVHHDGITPNAYLFAGEQWDGNVGSFNLRARMYSPAYGRFLSQDTWAFDPTFPNEMNRYAYALNNPLLVTDPSGNVAFFEYIGQQVNKLKAGVVQGISKIGYTTYFVFQFIAAKLNFLQTGFFGQGVDKVSKVKVDGIYYPAWQSELKGGLEGATHFATKLVGKPMSLGQRQTVENLIVHLRLDGVKKPTVEITNLVLKTVEKIRFHPIE